MVNLLPQENARVEKKDGSVVGPYKTSFAGDRIYINDVQADLEEGDVVLRTLPNGKDERNIITNATFWGAGLGHPARYEIEFKKGGTSEMQKPASNITILGAQSVQIGDYNTQNIVNVLQALSARIASSDATPREKEEAKSLLSNFLSHPLVTSILGAAAGAVLAQ
jgi:RIP homotypic interaction motif